MASPATETFLRLHIHIHPSLDEQAYRSAVGIAGAVAMLRLRLVALGSRPRGTKSTRRHRQAVLGDWCQLLPTHPACPARLDLSTKIRPPPMTFDGLLVRLFPK